jgi:hypothetical protein
MARRVRRVDDDQSLHSPSQIADLVVRVGEEVEHEVGLLERLHRV